jgi:hypothetical protein
MDELLRPPECRSLLWDVEETGMIALPVIPGRPAPPAAAPPASKGRNRKKIQDDPALATALWGRLAGLVPPRWEGRAPLGLSGHFSVYRQDPGPIQIPAQDPPVEGPRGHRAFVVEVWLNDGFTGGSLVFPGGGIFGRPRVAPAAGRAVLYPLGQEFQREEVRGSSAFLLRVDVLYGE